MSAAMAQSPVAVALRPRPWMKYTNDVRARFRRTQTAQALGITWIDYLARVHHAARRRGGFRAARGSGAASEGADHWRTGHWQYQSGAVLAGVSAGAARSGVCGGAKHSI